MCSICDKTHENVKHSNKMQRQLYTRKHLNVQCVLLTQENS